MKDLPLLRKWFLPSEESSSESSSSSLSSSSSSGNGSEGSPMSEDEEVDVGRKLKQGSRSENLNYSRLTRAS